MSQAGSIRIDSFHEILGIRSYCCPRPRCEQGTGNHNARKQLRLVVVFYSEEALWEPGIGVHAARHSENYIEQPVSDRNVGMSSHPDWRSSNRVRVDYGCYFRQQRVRPNYSFYIGEEALVGEERERIVRSNTLPIIGLSNGTCCH